MRFALSSLLLLPFTCACTIRILESDASWRTPHPERLRAALIDRGVLFFPSSSSSGSDSVERTTFWLDYRDQGTFQSSIDALRNAGQVLVQVYWHNQIPNAPELERVVRVHLLVQEVLKELGALVPDPRIRVGRDWELEDVAEFAPYLLPRLSSEPLKNPW